MQSIKTSVLVVDDDERMLRLMAEILEIGGYRTFVAGDGESALQLLEDRSPDLVLLDVMMPRMDGYEVCRRIRDSSRVPVIMVTAKGSEEEKIEGLDAGADDYITKPFSAGELTARVRAVLRRSRFSDETPEPEFRLSDMVIDFAGHRVAVGGSEIELTATEYSLLSYLARNAGRVLTNDQILQKVWGESYLGERSLLWVNVGRLRRKLGDNPGNPRFVLTRPGIGYMMPKEP